MASVNKSLKSAAAVLSLIAGESVHAQGFTETFGNAAGRVSNSYVTGFGYAASGGVTDGNYTVMPPQNVSGSTGQPYWANLTTDHTGTADGALMVLNAGSDYDDIYRRDFTMLPGHTYRVTGWRYVVNGANGAGSSDSLFWGIQIRDPRPISHSATLSPMTFFMTLVIWVLTAGGWSGLNPNISSRWR